MERQKNGKKQMNPNLHPPVLLGRQPEVEVLLRLLTGEEAPEGEQAVWRGVRDQRSNSREQRSKIRLERSKTH